MDLQEIRMRCVEAVARNNDQKSYNWQRDIIKRAQELETWVLNAEQDAFQRLNEA